MLDPNEAAEEIIDDGDAHMSEDDDENDQVGGLDNEKVEIELVNDSKTYFDGHTDSVFSLGRHPTNHALYLTGGADDTAQLWKIVPETPENPLHTEQLQIIKGHSDSVVAAGFLKPDGNYAYTCGLDGKLRVYKAAGLEYTLIFETKEVEEINWAEPHPSEPSLALGANDGTAWVYSVDEDQVVLRSTFHVHTASCTAGAWTPRGRHVATVSEDGSFYLWDASTGEGEVGLTSRDQRFNIEGGLYSIAIHPGGTVAVVGGATGECKVVSLPASARPPRPAGAPKAPVGGVEQQSGQIVASMSAHSEGVEALAFCQSPALPFMASGGIDGKVVIYDTTRGYAIRKSIDEAHEGAVVKLEFATRDSGSDPGVLTTVGIDGKLKRWDTRTGNLIGTWKGHTDGILGFVQAANGGVVSAGDDGVVLVFDTSSPPTA